MTDLSTTLPHLTSLWHRLDKAWLAFVAILAGVLVWAPEQFIPSLSFTATSLGHTSIFIAFAVLLMGTLKATGAETLVAGAFQGRESRMIILAALVGGIAPFCSCEVIPFIAALLAMGTPLSAVMAFWLASPIMDPPMFLITSSALGMDFAIAKTLSAVGMGLLGGFGVKFFGASAIFANPLRENAAASGCSSSCGTGQPLSGKPVWKFWTEPARRKTFHKTVVENGLFLLKWLALAYLIESLMLTFIPAEWIANLLGGEGFQPILLGALLGGPAYLNGYAAVPLIAGLLEQGMAPGAAMSFSLAGGVSCIPAAIAVWALVKPRVFLAYLGFAFVGSLSAGVIWAVVAQ